MMFLTQLLFSFKKEKKRGGEKYLEMVYEISYQNLFDSLTNSSVCCCFVQMSSVCARMKGETIFFGATLPPSATSSDWKNPPNIWVASAFS